MKKTILTILTFSVFVLSTKAQTSSTTSIKKDTTTYQKKNEFSISIGLDEGIPTAYVSKFSSFVMGASLQGEYMALRELGVTLSANYLYFLGKDGGEGLSMLPAMAGVNYYLTPKIFLSGQLGASWYVGKESSNSDTYFTYAQGIGFQPSKRISILAKYEGINVGPSKTYSFAGLRVAYKFYKK